MDSIFRDFTYEAYKNIFECIKYRGLKAESPQVDAATLIEIFRKNYECEVIATGRETTIFLLFAAKRDTKVGDLFKQIKSAITKHERRGMQRYSLVVDIDISKKPIILNLLNKITEEYAESISNQKTYYEIISYDQMTFNWPASDHHTPHSIVGPEDEDIKYLEATRLNKYKIRINDTGNIWCGGKPGDMIKIVGKNSLITYRIVINALV